MAICRRFLAVLVWAAVGFQAESAQASCGTAECPLDLSSLGDLGSGRPHWTSRFSVGTAWEYIAQDQPRHGREKVPFGQVARPDHDEIETINRNLRFWLDFDLSEHWDLQLAAPLINRSHSHLAAAGHAHAGAGHDHGDAGLTSWNFTRLGDLRLEVGYAPLAPRQSGPWLRFGLGLAAPTGSTGVRNKDGHLAEPSLQPGRGAWSVSFETEVGWQPAALQGARFFASGLYRHNFAGKRGYQFGDEAQVHTGGQYPLWRRLDLLLQLSARLSGRDGAGRTGELVDATGGRAVFLSPGLRLALLDGLGVYAYYQLPFYQRVNQVQLSADRNVLVGLNYRINLFGDWIKN